MGKSNYNHDAQIIENAQEIADWLNAIRDQLHTDAAVDATTIAEDINRALRENHNMKATDARFRPGEGTVSIKVHYPSKLERGYQEYYEGVIDAAPDGYHLHVETQE